jgi:arylsulfatase A-like enzyme
LCLLGETRSRAASFLHAPFLGHTGNNYSGLMHASDWLPTLFHAAGGNSDELGSIDGINLWENLADEVTPSKRNEMLYNINPLGQGDEIPGAALRQDMSHLSWGGVLIDQATTLAL